MARPPGSAALVLALCGLGAPGPCQQQTGAEDVEFHSWRRAGPPEHCVDVLFVSEGYTQAQKSKFRRDVDRYAKRFLEEPPFCWYKSRFDIRGAFVPSKDKGCDLSPTARKVDSVLDAHFDSPYGRLLVFRNRRALRKIVAAAKDVDIAFVMVNVEKYGGSGSTLPEVRVRGRPLAAPTFAAQDTASFLIAIHELGHSFGQLADEYVDPESAPRYRLPADGKDLEAANVTRRGHFDPTSRRTLLATLKWRRLMSLPGARSKDWLHEGAYFREKDVFRPWRDCMMRHNGVKFCPVCMAEMAKAIHESCGLPWDEAAFFRKHPLRTW